MDGSPLVANLHLHTITSDDRLTIGVLPSTAHAGGAGVAAMMGHGRYHPKLGALAVERDGVTVVRGVKLRADAGDCRIDLLGYGLRERSALVKTVEQPQRNRVGRAYETVAAIEEETGVRLKIDVHDDIGRPYVTRAIDASRALCDYQGAFDEFIGTDGPCYVTRELPTSDDDVTALQDTRDVADLVHLSRYHDSAGALEPCADLDAAERYCPYNFGVEADLIEGAIEYYGLLATDGSDAHDKTLDRAGLPETDSARSAATIDSL